MTEIIVLISVLTISIGAGVAIWSFIDTRKKFYNEFIDKRKKV